VLQRVRSVQRTLRFRWWALRARRRLRGAGCTLEVVAPHGAEYTLPPIVLPTRQGDLRDGRGGHVRIELGAGVDLGALTSIEIAPGERSSLVLGDGVVLGSVVRVLLFGGDIEVGAYSRLRDGTSLKSSGRLTCGAHTILQSHSMLHCAGELAVEDHVTFGERVSVLDSDHAVDGSDTYTQDQPLAVEPVHIGRNAWIGANAVLLRGTRLGANAVVAAGSVVRAGDYPAGWLVAGAPAEPKRPLGEHDQPTSGTTSASSRR
jgi:acetyltransferase-like isoleucine patch superfamily enzyme